MRNILKNRLALSTVVTTLIILVVSVLLAGVVTYFAINVVSTRVQEESLSLTNLHVWYERNWSYYAEAAFTIMNTGGRDVVIKQIQVRGQSADFRHRVLRSSLTNHRPCIFNLRICLLCRYRSFYNRIKQAPLALQSPFIRRYMIVYIANPDSITINDIGLTVGITVFTSQAMYYQETNVQAYVAPA